MPAKKKVVAIERKGVRSKEDPITEDSITLFRSWSKKSAAEACDQRLRYLEQRDRVTHIERGIIVLAMEQNEWFREFIDPRTGEGYNSIDRYLTDAAPISRSACYAAKSAIVELGKEIPREVLDKIPQCNLDTVKKLSSGTRKKKEVIKAAIEMEENQFLAKIEKEYPQEHISTKKPMKLKLDKDARVRVNGSLKKFMEAEQIPTREEALEAMCAKIDQDSQLLSFALDNESRARIERTLKRVQWAYTLSSPEEALGALCIYFDSGETEVPDYNGMTNLQAYDKAVQEGDI